MRLPRRRRPSGEPPQGVYIVSEHGVTACALVRDPQDRDGLAQWIAVPPPGTLLRPGDYLTVEVLPPRTAISLDFTAMRAP